MNRHIAFVPPALDTNLNSDMTSRLSRSTTREYWHRNTAYRGRSDDVGHQQAGAIHCPHVGQSTSLPLKIQSLAKVMFEQRITIA